ncbi:MAG TPA: hypothetical protein VM012_11110 [Flavitalea sp.]|nr:hypothetical protein [Flavitalea sp.]
MKTTVTLRTFLVSLLAGFILVSCNKPSKEDEKKANEFKAFTAAKKFKIVSFYADKPVDYDESDNVVKAETDLWAYVKEYIRDDINRVSDNGVVNIDQMTIKYPGNDEVTLIRPFQVGSDRDGAFLKFVDYFYEPLRYKLLDYKDNYFTIYIDYKNGAKLFSKYELVP